MPLQYPVVPGAEVTVFDLTEKKRPDALDRGSCEIGKCQQPEELKDLENSFRQCFGGEMKFRWLIDMSSLK